MSRRVAVLMAAVGMLLMGASAAWATGGSGGGAPRVVSTVPAQGENVFNEDPNITVTFSEAMKAKSINTKTIYLIVETDCPSPIDCDESPRRVPATVTYNAATKTATLDAIEPLPTSTTHSFTVVVEGTRDGDKLAVKDKGGTPMATDYILRFHSVCPAC